MAKIELTNKQLRLIQTALDFYSRVGIGQFKEILDHPTFQKSVEDQCIPNKTPEVGDRTPQGEILEIKNGKALINGSVKNGMWCNKPAWKKLKDVKLSVDYGRYHEIRDNVEKMLVQPRNILYGQFNMGYNGNWGIHHKKVDESCREAYDIIQVIRHEFWKADPKRSNITVDSSICLTTAQPSVKVELDTVTEIRKRKLKNLEK